MYLWAAPKGHGPDKYVSDEEFARIFDEMKDEVDWEKKWAAVRLPGIIDLGYWRKQNAIHKWFVENVQDGVDECDPFLCHPEMLADLMERCVKVKENPDLADELLPTQGGFFFGTLEYDEWYFEGIDETITFLEKTLAEAQGMDVYYQSSW